MEMMVLEEEIPRNRRHGHAMQVARGRHQEAKGGRGTVSRSIYCGFRRKDRRGRLIRLRIG